MVRKRRKRRRAGHRPLQPAFPEPERVLNIDAIDPDYELRRMWGDRSELNEQVIAVSGPPRVGSIVLPELPDPKAGPTGPDALVMETWEAFRDALIAAGIVFVPGESAELHLFMGEGEAWTVWLQPDGDGQNT